MAEYTERIGIKITLTGAEESTKSIDKLTESLSNLKKACSDVKTAAKNFDGLTLKVKATTSAVKTLASTISKVAIAKYLESAVSEAMKFSETLNYAHISMGEYTDSAIDYADKVNSIYGINQSNWLSYQSVFANLTSGFGVAKDKAALMSQQLTQLSYDIQSVVGESMGLSTKETAQKIQSGIAGELEPVRRLGYDLSKVKLEAIAAELGITKLFSEMTQGEKVQLRYYALMTQLPEVHGDFGRTLNEPANRLRVLQESFVALSRAIGNIFIPILQAIIPPLTVLVQLLTAVAQKIAEFMAKLFGYKENDVDYSGLGGVTTVVEDLEDELDGASGKAAKLKKQLAGFDEINNLTTPTSTSGSGNVSSGGQWVDFELPTYDFFKDFTGSKIEEIKEKLTGLIPIIAGVAAAIAVIGIAKGLPYVIALFDNWGALVLGMKAKLATLGTSVTSLWGAIAAHPIVAVIAVIAGLVAAFITAYKTNDEFRERVQKAWKAITENFKNSWESIKNFLGNMKQGIADFFTASFENVRYGLNKFIGGISAFAKKVVDGLNNLFSKLNKVGWIIPDWVPLIGGNSFGFNISPIQYASFGEVPQLATGGIVDKSTIVNIGENGFKEAVIPLERNTSWMDTLATKVSTESSNTSDTILEAILDRLMNMDLTVTLDGESIAKNTVGHINNMTRIQGKGVLI